MFTQRTNQARRRTPSLLPTRGARLGVVAAAVLAAVGAGCSAAAEPTDPDFGIMLEQRYLTSDVGGTVILRPRVFTSRPDGSRTYVPEGAPVGTDRAIEFALPLNTSSVGLDQHKSCRIVKSTDDPGQHIRCGTVAPLTIRVDRALTAVRGGVGFVPRPDPGDGTGLQDDFASFVVTAPAPQEEGETEGSRERREAVGVSLLGVAGGFVVLALVLLAGGRARRTVWVSCTAAAVCAGLGTWSMVHGPLLGSKTVVRGYPAGPPTLQTPDLIWDGGAELVETRPDFVPPVATAPEPGQENVTEVSALYVPAYVPTTPGDPSGWVTLNGAYGRIEDPRRARNHMLETAARASGVKVVKKPQLIVLTDEDTKKPPVLFKCQALSVGDRTVGMCAWADSGVRALVTTSAEDLLWVANTARQLRDTVQMGESSQGLPQLMRPPATSAPDRPRRRPPDPRSRR